MTLYTLNEMIQIWGENDYQVSRLLECSVYSENKSLRAFRRISIDEIA